MRRSPALLAVVAALTALPVGIPGTAVASSTAPVVTGLTPPAGHPAGGDRVTIVGRGLSKVTSVRFGTAVSSQVSVVSPTRITVVTPEHALGTVSVHVRSKDGSVSPQTDAARYTFTNPPAPLDWSAPAEFDPLSLYYGYAKISCATSEVCIADPYPLSASDPVTPVMRTGGTWRRVHLPPAASGTFTRGNASACPLPRFCLVVGTSGDGGGSSPTVWTWDGSSWSVSLTEPPTAGASTFRRPVCARGYAYCLVSDGNGLAQIYNAGQWTTAAQPFSPISCASDTFCIVRTTTGYAVWNGSTVGPGTEPFGGADPGISCATASFCLAIASSRVQSLQWTFDGNTWSTADSPDLAGFTTVPSCLTATSCWLIEFDNGVSRSAQFDGQQWARGGRVSSKQQTWLDCWAADGCRSVDRGGNIHTFTQDQWHVAQPIPRTGIATDVSCASRTMCMAVDRTGHALRFDGTGWQPPKPADIFRELLSVSCPTSHFCMAVDGRGYAVRYANGAWHKPTSVLTVHASQTMDVSCATSSFCVAVLRDGRAAVYNGVRWRQTPRVVSEAGNYLTSVSCSSPNRCVAVGNGLSVYNGGWRPAVSGSTGFFSVSCVGETCAATAHTLWIRNGAAFAGTGVNASEQVVCATRHFCLVSSSRDGSVATDGASWANAKIPSNYFVAGDCAKHFCMLLLEAGAYPSLQETHATR